MRGGFKLGLQVGVGKRRRPPTLDGSDGPNAVGEELELTRAMLVHRNHG
jgi:hypothetical protein